MDWLWKGISKLYGDTREVKNEYFKEISKCFLETSFPLNLFFFSPIIKVIIENSENTEKNKENINPTQS